MPRLSRAVIAAAALAGLAFLAVAPASAQLNPLRRAKDKAKQAAGAAVAGQQGSTGTVTFDNTVLELNPQLVTRMIAGLQARARYKGPTGETALQLRRRATQADSMRQALNSERSDDIQRYNTLANDANNCRGEYLSGLQNKHMQEAMQRMVGGATASSDKGQAIAAMAQASADMSQAMASGDSVALRRATAAYYKALGIDPKADTAAANTACHVPPKQAWMTRIDSLGDAGTKAWELARDLERQAADTAILIAGGGITAEQFAMAAERMEAWVALEASSAAGRGLWKFSVLEEKTLRERKNELVALFS